jgi:hypothetical protein
MNTEFFAGMWKSFSAESGSHENPGHRSQVYTRLNMARRFVLSYFRSRRELSAFQDVHTYCMFIGHARSGGSLAGALLDAHPNIILADEVDALQYVSAGFSREQVYHILLKRSRIQAKKGRSKAGRDEKTYSYQVPGQSQGHFTRLLIIGDRKAGKSTQRLGEDPALLQRLQQTMKGTRIAMIAALRNPFDTISTMNIRSGRPLAEGIDLYFSNCETIRKLQDSLGSQNLYILKHEDLLNSPDHCLADLTRFLGIEASQEYINDCVSVLYKSPKKTRQKIQWSGEMIEAVQRKIDQYPFLQGYSFES